jgi:nucleoside-diphosphate-sugar epimerase
MKILILGGTGFVSGTLARRALADGHRVWCITRGGSPLPRGVVGILADRQDNSVMEEALGEAGVHWDLVVDCIGYEPEDARQDLQLFGGRADHLVFISTDFVYSHVRRHLPVREEGTEYQMSGYGGKKRICEEILIESRPSPLQWTVLRPTHIYGPGSLLGCLPHQSRDPELPEKIAGNSPLRLVGGGHFLQQPVHARDLAELCLGLAGNPQTYGQVLNVAGPDIVESREYYRILAESLERELIIEETSTADYLREHPEQSPLLCHRIYDLQKLQATGVPLPSTRLQEGLIEHLRHLLEKNAGT